MHQASGNVGDLATAGYEGLASAGWTVPTLWYSRPLLLQISPGTVVVFWPACQDWPRDGGEAEYLSSIEVAKGDGNRETMNTGVPV